MGLEMVTRKPPLVLLTAYNGAAYLPAQLSSLCAQAVSFTAILRDDGSADDTPALLAAQCHQDARFRLSPTSGVHLGAVGGFFALMREAADSGAPVALCDQDDIWHPDKLTRLQAPCPTRKRVSGRIRRFSSTATRGLWMQTVDRCTAAYGGIRDGIRRRSPCRNCWCRTT